MNGLIKYKHIIIFFAVSAASIFLMLFYVNNADFAANKTDPEQVKEYFISGDGADIDNFLSSDAELILCYLNSGYGRTRAVKIKDRTADIYLISAGKVINYEKTNLKNDPAQFASLFYAKNRYKIQQYKSIKLTDGEYSDIIKAKKSFEKNTKTGYMPSEDIGKSHVYGHKYWDTVYVLTDGKMYMGKSCFGEDGLADRCLRLFKDCPNAYPDGWDDVMEYYYYDKTGR